MWKHFPKLDHNDRMQAQTALEIFFPQRQLFYSVERKATLSDLVIELDVSCNLKWHSLYWWRAYIIMTYFFIKNMYNQK